MLLPLIFALQQGLVQGAAPVEATTPPSRDTTGYWQQRADYRIEARLDERAQRLEARGTLRYTNHSPDTLRELYLHQHLNAFRPRSGWSEADAREGRVRFQALRDPDFGYERFTEAPRIGGVAVTPEYSGSPDSTVVRLPLPQPLPPGGTVEVAMAWHARPATVPRRQGRRGRQWDFAHWYPRVAVYDRGGWEPNTLVPAGEFYSEFGDFDVRLTLAGDQVVGTTGVVVAGDPGWEGARRWGAPLPQRDAYPVTADAGTPAAAGEKVLRIVARDVHTFAFSVSPDYRYEGGAYVRARGEPWSRFRTWDTVAVHVLYRPGDERDWGNGQAVQRTVKALEWLERVYGPYAYPQVTNLHRLDGGGTEYPMMMMNGSASQGLILHEGGHIFSYGILANNEWRSGWMDEGLTSYQTSWAQGLTRHERARGGAFIPARAAPAPPPGGYARRALRPEGPDASLGQWRQAVQGTAQPIGTRATEFRDFGTYNNMIYSRAEMMYGALRDAIGDTAFAAFLRDYYARWGLRHVDEPAMRASAERAAGRELGWFFDQWVHDVGVLDYALLRVRTRREGDAWVTRATVGRRGRYRHPMPVGARTASGWTIVRGDPLAKRQEVVIRTSEKPTEVRLDPERTTEDWYRPNDVLEGWWIFKAPQGPRNVIDWPLLDQASADRSVIAWSPLAWYAQPGNAAVGVRLRGSYRGIVSRSDVGIASYTAEVPRPERCGVLALGRCDEGAPSRLSQYYASVENPYLGSRPAMGLRLTFAELDGVTLGEVRWSRERRQMPLAPSAASTRELWIRYTRPFSSGMRDPLRWDDEAAGDVGGALGWRDSVPAGRWRRAARIEAFGGIRTGDRNAYVATQAEVSLLRRAAQDRTTTFARLWAGNAGNAVPRERLPLAGSRSATEHFLDHLVRPPEALLMSDEVQLMLPGGPGLRGYDGRLVVRRAAAANVEHALRLATLGSGRRPRLFATAFANGLASVDGGAPRDWLAEAGVGLALRGPLFDRELKLRADVPLWLDQPALATAGQARDERVGLRISLAAGELW